MRLVLLATATLIAFAANSILNRAALAETTIDPAVFTGVRLLSGAAMLALIVMVTARPRAPIWRAGSPAMATALIVYAVAFSFAYVTLDAGVGALILFGGVQVTMFAGALWGGERPGLRRWLGSAMGLLGLAILYLPGISGAPDPVGALLMLAAAAGWGIYSLLGRTAGPPLLTTAGNFVRSAPVGLVLFLGGLALGTDLPVTGVLLAIASGAIASGLGYAIWYTLLPHIDASLAAVGQLTVPLIALGGGVLFLGERADLIFAASAALVLGGVAIALPRRSGG